MSRRPEIHTIIGTRHQIANVIRTAHTRGQLVTLGPVKPVPHDRSKVCVIATFTKPTIRPPRRITRRHQAIIAAAVAGLTVAALMGWAMYLLVQLVVAHWALIVGLLTAVGVALLLASRAGVCPGIHCPGCRHR
jgi:hypothetical protein